jgi:superfamily II DNA or RNA helicase
MQLRDYQQEFCDSVVSDLHTHKRVMGVAATGAGKTIMASELMRIARGNTLFLADAQQLVWQNADKFRQYTGFDVQVEQAENHAHPGAKTVVGTTQSMARRLDKWPRDYFSLIIMDECHRNCLGDQAKKVLGHFAGAKELGLTATPFRTDRKKLGDHYEKISYQIGLPRLIKEGHLSPITIKSVPIGVDLSKIRIKGGDYRTDDLDKALSPYLLHAADLLAKYASDRKTVAFLPLIHTSKMFRDACQEVGLKAVHVDGTDKSALKEFTHGDAQVICNASLLTTGWDFPPLDCVFILRPTKSLALYQQQVGRGTRIHPGKENLLLLDPLYLTDRHKLITPARLVATTKEEVEYINGEGQMGEEMDILELKEAAEDERLAKLEEELALQRRKQARTVDAVEFCLGLNERELATYEPEMAWEMEPPSQKQLETLYKFGLDDIGITNRGHVSKVLDLLFARKAEGLATPKQVRLLKRFQYPDPGMASFQEASAFISKRLGR